MAIARKRAELKAVFADKKVLQQIVAEQNALIGLEKDPNATPEQAQQMILADGVRPEDNLFSRDIIAAREE